MHIAAEGKKIPLLSADALVIGAGAAGLNAADELQKRGLSVLLAADVPEGGASRNAGSDKQTFFRQSLHGDSIEALARDLFAGGHMNGDTAWALAAGSSRAFFKLCDLGVPFPQDAWGDFPGYRTDHDAGGGRATSAGPLTSRIMSEKLAGAVERRGVRFVQGKLVRLLTQGERVMGALLMQEDAQGDPQLTCVVCGAVVLCTGGSADLYQHSVHPTAQVGAMGAALSVGAKAANLWSWQYGIASTDVRWNLSGSYQQVLPLYRDEQGEDIIGPWAHENPDDLIFLKGYQWPFDGRKADGSTRIDLAVYAAQAQGRQVFLDFRQQDEHDRLRHLGAEARDYLQRSGAAQASPIERLAHLNPDALAFYQNHSIDLRSEPLAIALCAQHQNGGLAVDSWWRTTVAGLYAAGEVAGCYGAYRPGGSALLETQVGSLRAAQHIAAHKARAPQKISADVLAQVEREVRFLREGARAGGDGADEMHVHLRREMSLCAGAVRRVDTMQTLYEWCLDRLSAPHHGSPATMLRWRDALYCAVASLSSMLKQGKSMPCAAGHLICTHRPTPQDALHHEDAGNEGRWIETALLPGGATSQLRDVRPLPDTGEGWFENVWRDFREGAVFR